MAFDFITSSFTSFFLVFSSEDGDNSTCSERAHLILVGYFAALLFLLLANFLERALLKHLTMHRLITLMYKNDDGEHYYMHFLSVWCKGRQWSNSTV